MDDSVLLWLSIILAAVGLCLLFFVKPEAQDNPLLHGTVLERHGLRATVLANVTVIGTGLVPGHEIEKPVFWNGEAFVVSSGSS